jgi:hypothetical protein
MRRRPLAFFLAIAVLTALARPARADDAKKATDAFMKGVVPAGVGAAAAMQGVGNAAAAGGAPNGPKKDEGGFSRALTAPRIDETTDGGLDQAPSKKNRPRRRNRRNRRNTGRRMRPRTSTPIVSTPMGSR